MKNERKADLLNHALRLARQKGYARVTREAIAEAAGVSPGLVSYHFGTTPNMKRDIMRAAVTQEIVEVIAQGLADRNPYALKAPEGLKKRAVAHLAG